jgi:hypothetical protein
LSNVDGEPPGISFQEDGFPHVQDVVDDAACESARDFNAKFVRVVSKFYTYHGFYTARRIRLRLHVQNTAISKLWMQLF